MSVLTQDILNSIEKRYNRHLPKVFIETGTFKGETIANVANVFPIIHTFELDEKWYREVVGRFKEQKHINCHYGDSAEGLKKILPGINEPIVFWLDAHYCGLDTSLGDEEVPLLRELEVIAPRKYRDIIMIDDAFLFGTSRTFNRETIPPFTLNWENITVESIKKAIHWESNYIMRRYNDNILVVFTNLTPSEALRLSELEINRLDHILFSEKSEVKRLNQKLSAKEAQIKKLNNELSQIRLSITWRIAKKIHRIIDLVIPVGSKRKALVSFLLSRIRAYT